MRSAESTSHAPPHGRRAGGVRSRVAGLMPDPQGPLDARLFETVSLVAAVMALVVVVPFNHFQRLSPWINVVVVLFGLAALALWHLARRGRRRPVLLLAALLVTLSALWFLNGGSWGSIPFYFFDAALIPVVFCRGRLRSVLVVLVGVNALALYGLEHAFPGLVVPFMSAADQKLDLVTGFLICLTGIVVVLRFVVNEYAREQVRLADVNARLQQSLDEVRTLRGLLPVCSWCKKIRDDQGLWRQVEDYLLAHSDAAVTHGMCPDCYERSRRELDEALAADAE